MRRAALLLLGLALARDTGAAGAERAVRANAETAGGVRLATFETPQGTIQAYLPAELQRGDCATGAVRLEPAGRNGAARRAAAAALSRHTLRFGGESLPLNAPAAAWHVPAGAAGAVPLALASPEGRELARTDVPVLSAAAPPSGTRLPVLAEAGGTGAASGRFGCEAPRVRLDGMAAEVLAASPRIVVFSVPRKLVGTRALEIFADGTTVKGTVHVVSIALSAPQTKLKRGERTVATVVVSGLLGLKEAVTLALTNESPGVVSMGGGNVQPLTIQPSAIGRDGTFRAERVLTGIEPGTFTIAAVLPLPDERHTASPVAEKRPPPTLVREEVPTHAPVTEELPTPVREELPAVTPVTPAATGGSSAPGVTPAQPASPSEPVVPVTPDPGVPWWLGGLVVALGAASLLVPVRPKPAEPMILGWMGGGFPPGVVPPPITWDPKKVEEALRKAAEEATKAGERLKKAGEDYNKENEDYTKAQEEYLRAKEYYDWLLDLLTHWRPLDAPYGGPKMHQRVIERESDGHGGLKPPTRRDIVDEDVYTRRMTQHEVEEELKKAKAAMDHLFEIVKKKSAAWTKAREALDKASKDVKDGVDWVDYWRQELALGPPEQRPPPVPVKPFDPLEGVERIGGQPALVEHEPQFEDPLSAEQMRRVMEDWKARIPPFPPSRGSGPGPGDLDFDEDGYLRGWWLPPSYSIEEEIRYYGRGREPVEAPGEGAVPAALESRGETPLVVASEQPGAWIQDEDGNWVPVDPTTGRRREPTPPVRTPEDAERARKRVEKEMRGRDEAWEKEREKRRQEESKREREAEEERLGRQRDFTPPPGAPPGTWVRDPWGRWIEIDPKTGAPLVKAPPERTPDETERARKKAEELAKKRDAEDRERVKKAEEEREKEQKQSDEERWAEQGKRDRAPSPPGPVVPPPRTPEEAEAVRKKAEEEMKRREEAHEKEREKARGEEEQRHRESDEERKHEKAARDKAAKEDEDERLYGQGRRDAAAPPPAGPDAWVKDGDGNWVQVDPKTGRPLGKAPRPPEEAEAARKKAEAEMKRREEAHEKEREKARAEEEKSAKEAEEERLLRQHEAGEPPAVGEVWARDRHGRWVRIDSKTGMPFEPPRKERTPEEEEAALKKIEKEFARRDAADHEKVRKAEEEREKSSRADDEERWGRAAATPDTFVPPGPGAWVKDPAGRWVQVDPRTGQPLRRERTPEEAEAAHKRAEKEMERRERVWQEQRKKRQEADAKRRWEKAHPSPPPVAPAPPKTPPPAPPQPPADLVRDDARAWAKGALGLTDENHPLVQLLIAIGREIGIDKLRDFLRDFRPSSPVSGLVEVLEKLQPKTGAQGERLRARQAILEILDSLARDPTRLNLWGVTDPASLTPLFEAAVSKLVDEALADGSLDALLRAAIALARPKELGGNPEHPRAGEVRDAIARHLDTVDAAKDKADHEKIASGSLDEKALREIAKKALDEHRFGTWVEARLAALAKSTLPATAKAAEAIGIAQALKKLAKFPVEQGMTPDVVHAIENLQKKARAGLDVLKKGLDAGLVPELDRLIDEAAERASLAAGEAYKEKQQGNKEKEASANERRQTATGEVLDLSRLREMLATSPLDEAAAKRELARRLEEAWRAAQFEGASAKTDGASENAKGRDAGHLGALRARRDAIRDVVNGFDPDQAAGELDNIYDALNGTWHKAGDSLISERGHVLGTGSQDTAVHGNFRENGIRQKLDEARQHKKVDEVRRLEEDVDYYERRRIQVLLGHPGWDSLENYVRIKEHEKGYWQSQKNWKELAWWGETPADRWAKEIPAYRSRDLPGLINAVNRAKQDPQAFIRFLGKLRAEDVAEGAAAWEAYYATPWHDRGLVVQTWRLAHVGEILEKMGSDRYFAAALQFAGTMSIEKLKRVHPEAYDLLWRKDFISRGAYAVPDDFTYTPESVGSQMSQRHWLDDILNVKNVAEIVLTVLIPGAGAGWVVGGVEALQAAQGATKLARAGYYVGRAALEAALFTALSKGMKGVIHPFSLTGQELSPEALAKETVSNFAAILGLGLLGRAAAPLEKILIGEGKAAEALLKPISQVGRDEAAILLKKTGFEGVKLTVEAGGMTVLSGDFDPKTFPEAFLHNLVFLAELKVLHPEVWTETRKKQSGPSEGEAAKPREAGGGTPGEGRQRGIAETPGKPEVEEFTPDSEDATPKGKKPARRPATQPPSPMVRLGEELGLKGTDGLKEKILEELDRLSKDSPDPRVRETAGNAKRAVETGQVPLDFGILKGDRGEYSPVTRRATIDPARIARDLDAWTRENLDRPATKEEFIRSLAGTVVHEALVHGHQGVDAMPLKEGLTRPYSLAHEMEAYLAQRLIDPTLGGKDPLGAYRTEPADVLKTIWDIVVKGYADAVDPVRKSQLKKAGEAEFFGHTGTAGDPKVGEKAAKLRGLRGEGPSPAEPPKSSGPPPSAPPTKIEAASGDGPARPPEPVASLDDLEADAPRDPGSAPPEYPGRGYLRELGIDGFTPLVERLVREFDLVERTSKDPLARDAARAARTALESGEIAFTATKGSTFDPKTRRSSLDVVEIAEQLDLTFTGRGEAARGPDFLRAIMGHVARQAWGHGLGGAETFASESLLHAQAEGHVVQRLFDPPVGPRAGESAETVREKALRELSKKQPDARHLLVLGVKTIAELRTLLKERAKAIAEPAGERPSETAEEARRREAARALVHLLEGGDVDLSTTSGPSLGGYDPVTRRVVLHIPTIADELEALSLEKGRPATAQEFVDSLLGVLVHEGVVHSVQGFDVKPQADGLTRPYRRAHEVEAFQLQRLFDPTLASREARSIGGTELQVLEGIVRLVFEAYPGKKIGDMNATMLRGVDPAKLERWERARAQAEEILQKHGDPKDAGDLLYGELESLLFDRTIEAGSKDAVREKAAKLRALRRAGIPPDLYSRFSDAEQRRALLGEVARVAAGFDLTRWREGVRGRPAEEARLLQILRDADIGDPGAAAGGPGELDARLASFPSLPHDVDASRLKAELDAAMEGLADDPGNTRLLRRALRFRTLLGGLGMFGGAGPAADFPIVVDAPGRDGVSPVEALQLLLAEARRTAAEFRHDASLRAHVARLRAAEAALRARGAFDGPPAAGEDLDAALDDDRWDEFWAGFHAAQRRVLAPLLKEAAQ